MAEISNPGRFLYVPSKVLGGLSPPYHLDNFLQTTEYYKDFNELCPFTKHFKVVICKMTFLDLESKIWGMQIGDES